MIWITFLLLFSFRHDYGKALFCLDPARTQSGLVWCWYSMKLVMFNRRLPRPSCECQASFWHQRWLFFFSDVSVFKSFRGWKAFSQILSNSLFQFTFSSSRLNCLMLMTCVLQLCIAPFLGKYSWPILIWSWTRSSWLGITQQIYPDLFCSFSWMETTFFLHKHRASFLLLAPLRAFFHPKKVHIYYQSMNSRFSEMEMSNQSPCHQFPKSSLSSLSAKSLSKCLF